MKKSNVWLLVITSIIIAFDVAMLFVLNTYSFEIKSQDSKILYYSVKSFSILALFAYFVIGFLKKDVANYIVQYGCTLVLQFLPLMVRYLSIVENGFVISLVITFVIILVYLGIIIGFSVLNKKTLEASKKLEGKTIPVQEENE